MTVQSGWYKDPAEPSTQRYWDGEGWVGAPVPADATPPPGPPPAAPEPPAEPPASAAPPTTGPSAEPQPSTPPAGTGPNPPWGSALPPGTPFPPGPGFPSGTPYPPGAGYPGGQPVPGPPADAGWQPAPNGPTQGVPGGWGPVVGRPYAYPYQMPAPRPHGFALAPLGPRLVARLIDIGILLLLNVFANGLLVWRYAQEMAPVYREIVRRALANDSSTAGLPQTSEQAGRLQIAILLVIVALWFAYEVPALANSGQTLGKRLMRLKVVSLSAEQRLGFGRAMRRWNTLGLPVFLWFCCLGFVLQLIDCVFPLFDRPLRQALHDKRAQTVVVQVPRAVHGAANPPPDEPTDTSGGPA